MTNNLQKLKQPNSRARYEVWSLLQLCLIWRGSGMNDAGQAETHPPERGDSKLSNHSDL